MKYQILPSLPFPGCSNWHKDQGNSGSAFPVHVVGEVPCSSQPTAPTCVVWSWHLQECFALASAVKGLWYRGIFPVHEPDGYAMLMSPNEGKTAVHGCHCPGDMAVRMREVLARPWVSECVPLVLSLSQPAVCLILFFLKGKPDRRL